MSNPPGTSGITPSEAVSDQLAPKRTMVRAGRLAGGAVVSAWVLSVIYHIILFVVMWAIPWLSDGTGDHPEGPTVFTSIVGDPDRPMVKLSPPPALDSSAVSDDSDPLDLRPETFQAVTEIAPVQQAGSLTILGIGMGGGEFDKYGFEVGSRGEGPSFFGVGGQARGARRIVYVVDRSGSMMTTMHGVIKELKESVGRLRRTQKFHVVFFNSGPPLENPPKRLVSAIQAHKREAFGFFDTIVPGGSTDPTAAMRRAFKVDPDLIYFLTDGEFDSRLIETLNQLNRGRAVRIFTIAYVSQSGAALLERIAREHKGEYRFVSEDEIF